MNVFLVPMGEYPKTISTGVEVERIRHLFSNRDLTSLDPLMEDGKVRFWGCRGRTRFVWASMKPNDDILFVPRALGYYSDFGRLGYKSQNRKLAETMASLGYWPEDDYEYVFFIRDHKSIKLPKARVNSIAGWGKGVPFRFTKVASLRVRRGILGLVEPEH